MFSAAQLSLNLIIVNKPRDQLLLLAKISGEMAALITFSFSGLYVQTTF